MSRLAFPLLLLLAASQDAALPSPWRKVQELTVPRAGPLKIDLPVETLDSARSSLEDLRLLDEGGREISWVAERPRQEARASIRSARFETSLEKEATVLLIETGFSEPLEQISIETPSEGFIKAVRLEGSSDRKRWTILRNAEPLFVGPARARKLHIDLARAAWPFIRLTLDDQKSAPVPVTGVVLLPAAPPAAPAEAWSVEIVERLEEPGRTHLRLRFPGRHVTLAEIGIDTPEPLFTRRVALASRSYADGRVSESLLAEGTLYRMAQEGSSSVSKLSLAADVLLPERELLLTIENADSPPLQVTALHVRRRPVRLTFTAPKAGRLHLLSENPDCPAPRYDLAALPAPGRELPVEPGATVSALRDNPSYRAPEALPGLGGPGAAIDPSPWGFRKPVRLGAGAIHQLELDIDVLSHAAHGAQDLRLVREGKQLPYVVESTSLSRPISLPLASDPDPKRPTLSRWSIALPRKRVPVSRLTFTAPEALFHREVRLSEDIPDDRGVVQRVPLASASWVRRAGSGPLVLTIQQEPRGDRLLLEVENGDNPPLTLTDAKAWFPLTRILFKTSPGPDLHLYYGNPQARAPEYDLALAAPQLLVAARLPAALGSEEVLAAAPRQAEGASGSGNWLFWGVLALMVVGLLLLISRLLPAPPKEAR
jgi:hypothetical protein